MSRWDGLFLLVFLGAASCGGGSEGSGERGGTGASSWTGGAGADSASGGRGAGGAAIGGAAPGGAATGGAATGGAATGGAPIAESCAGASLPPPPTDCGLPEVLCVDDTPGATQEHATIQEAADVAGPGDTIVVFGGTYAGFEVDTSGTAASPIVFVANGDVQIDSPAATGDGIRLQNVSHVRIIGFSVGGVPQRCIAARGATPEVPMVALWIVGNECLSPGVEGFYLSEVSGSHIELNSIHGSGASGDTRSHGMYLANAGSDGTTLCGNVISGASPAESNGIHMNGDASIGGDGIISGLVVEANILYDNQQNGFNLDGVQDSVFRNNLVYGNGRNALRAYAIDAAEGPKGLVVVGNTFLTPATGGWSLKLTEDEGGHVVFNNILLTENPDTGSIALASSPAFASASNVVVDRFSPDDEVTLLSLADWQARGFDTGSVVSSAAALFVTPGSDFHSRAGSPAIDAGLATFAGVSAPSTDLEGAVRPQGAGHDMGAFEAP